MGPSTTGNTVSFRLKSVDNGFIITLDGGDRYRELVCISLEAAIDLIRREFSTEHAD